MRDVIVFTADKEEPDCNRCDHCCDNYDCSRFCGPEHGWYGYSRSEVTDEEN